MRFSILASGSGGNACYIETGESRILIDAGLSCRELFRRLEAIGISPETIDALVITHEHTDHIRGAGALARRIDIPVYMSSNTFRRCLRSLGRLSKPVPVQTGQTFTIHDLRIETFTKCHDAADPMGLVIATDSLRLGFVTDLGRSTRLVEDRLKGCRALIVEFNHDPGLLENGPYPLHLKRRIRGPEGHLSNEQGGDLLRAVYHEGLKLVVLAHISKQNNHPHMALKEARKALDACGLVDTKIVVSHQDRPTPVLDV